MSFGRIVTILLGIVSEAAFIIESAIESAVVSKFSLLRISCQFIAFNLFLNSS